MEYGTLRLKEDKLRLVYTAVYEKRGRLLSDIASCTDLSEKKMLRKQEHGYAYIARKVTKELFDLTTNG